jgi:DNA-binding transcriptional MocR family regulator
VTQEGWEAGTLAGRATRRRPPVVGHVTPDFQNPTGLHATDDQRRGILAATAGTVLVVDETFADLALEPSRTPLATLDPTGRTLTVGTLSKTVWAGLRIGWIRADPALVRRLSLLRGGQDLATPVLDQLFALACLDHLSTIIDERRALVRRRRDHLLATLATRAPTWRPNHPEGGLVVWVDLGDQSSTQLANAAHAAGVRVTPGPRFSATGTHDRFLRVPFSLPEPVLDEAVDALVGVSSARRTPVGTAATTWTA